MLVPRYQCRCQNNCCSKFNSFHNTLKNYCKSTKWRLTATMTVQIHVFYSSTINEYLSFLPHKTHAKRKLTIAAFTSIRSIDIVYFVHDLCRVRLITVNNNHNICMSHLPASTHNSHSSAPIYKTITELKWDYSSHIHMKTICITTVNYSA